MFAWHESYAILDGNSPASGFPYACGAGGRGLFALSEFNQLPTVSGLFIESAELEADLESPHTALWMGMGSHVKRWMFAL